MTAVRKIVPFFATHSGCPWKCNFCDQFSIEGVSPNRDEAIEKFRREMEKLVTPPHQVAFYGGDFLNNAEKEILRIVKIAESLVEEKFGVKAGYRASSSPVALTPGKLEFVKELGFETVEIGVVSTDEEVLAKAGRRYGRKEIFEAIANCRRFGFEVGVQLVAGLPGDDLEKFHRTLEEVFSARPDFARLYPLVVLDGTPLGEAYKRGEFVPWSDVLYLKASALFSALAACWGVKVARIGLHLGDAVREALLHEPRCSNLRQEGEGMFLAFAVEEIFGAFGGMVEVVVPKKYETSLRGKEGRRLESIEKKWKNNGCSVRFEGEGEALRVLKYNEACEAILKPSLFARKFAERILEENVR